MKLEIDPAELTVIVDWLQLGDRNTLHGRMKSKWPNIVHYPSRFNNNKNDNNTNINKNDINNNIYKKI